MDFSRIRAFIFVILSAPLCAQPFINEYAGRWPLTGLATSVSLNSPNAIAADASGNLYICSWAGNLIFKVTPFGQLSIVAVGDFSIPASGNGPVPVLGPQLGGSLIAAGTNGDIYIADNSGLRIRRILGGVVTTIADGGPGFSGDGGPAIDASFTAITALAVDTNGSLLIADGSRIRKITGSTISTIAGTGNPGFGGDNGPALAAQFGLVDGLAVGSSGEIFFSDDTNKRVRRIVGGIMMPFAGNGGTGSTGDGGPAAEAELAPGSLAVDAAGNVYIADAFHGTLRKVAGGVISTVAGSTDSAPVHPRSLALDGSGALYVSDLGANVVYRFSKGIRSVAAGNGRMNFNSDGIVATNSVLSAPQAVVVDSLRNLYISDTGNHSIRKVAATGIITTLQGRINDPYPYFPHFLAIDKADNLYVASFPGQVLKYRDGSFTIFAGTGIEGFSGDGGPAINSTLGYIDALTAGDSGVLYIAESGGRIRRVAAGIITTVAGNGTFRAIDAPCESGPATAASIGVVQGLTLDQEGSLLISDSGCLHKLVANTLTIQATLPGWILAIAMAPSGTLYAVAGLNTIVKVEGNQLIPFAGTGAYGLEGDGGPALSASLVYPASLAVDRDGKLFLAEPGVNRVRVISDTPPIAVTVNTSPANLPFSVDGVSYPSAQTFSWFPGIQHTLSVASPTAGGSTYAYLFRNWTDGGAAEHPIPSPGVPFTYTATFTKTPTLAVNRSNVEFGVAGSIVTSPQVVTVSTAPGVAWSVSAAPGNIRVSPATGIGPGSFTISVVSGPSGRVDVSAVGVAFSPQLISVAIVPAPKSSAPFGILDTPVDQATVVGPIPVTGWALDQVEVSKVTIWRDPVQGEKPTGNGLIYIGDAVFTADARPDVAAAYPNYPLNYRGGWGLQVLTNVLPNADGSAGNGNGIYKLHAIAENNQGLVAEVGKKTITVANATSTKPFGTIDTPSQGGVASGASYVNFGWALTPPPNQIPLDGSTIDVYVDGQNLGHPTYNQYRSDIAATFPGYLNTNGGVGYFRFDTTGMLNGQHSIGWTVVDNGGRIEGIGSRVFDVLNPGAPAAATLPSVGSLNQPVTYRLGFGRDAAPREFHPGETIGLEQLGRLELHLGPGASASKLPIGAKLDAITGIFYWQPPASFLGKHELRFTRQFADGTQEAVPVKVQIGGVRE